MNLAAIYARLSTDDKGQTSIPKQIDFCKSAASKHGYKVTKSYVFIDDGYSGALLERPDLNRLLALVRSRSITAVFVADGDRLSREPAHDWLIRQELKHYDVTLYVNGQAIDTTPEGEVKDGFMALFAKYERLKITERMRQGKLRRAGLHKPEGSGRPLGGLMALGYRYVPDTKERKGEVELVLGEADLVRRIYRMYLDGMGMFQVAKQLTTERAPTKADRDGRAKQQARGIWSTSSIAKILKNESYYTGIMTWNRYQRVPPDDAKRRKPKNLKHPKTTQRLRDKTEWLSIPVPKIIDEQTFLAAQSQIAKNRATNKRRRKHEYMFLGGRLHCI